MFNVIQKRGLFQLSHLGAELGLRWNRIAGRRRYDFLEGNPAMAWLEEHPTSGHFKICFRWGGRKLKKTVKTESRREAEGVLARFEENIDLLERGRIELPSGADIGTFLLSDGKLASMPSPTPPPKPLTLGETA